MKFTFETVTFVNLRKSDWIPFPQIYKVNMINIFESLPPTWRVIPISKWWVAIVSKSRKDRDSLVINGL